MSLREAYHRRSGRIGLLPPCLPCQLTHQFTGPASLPISNWGFGPEVDSLLYIGYLISYQFLLQSL